MTHRRTIGISLAVTAAVGVLGHFIARGVVDGAPSASLDAERQRIAEAAIEHAHLNNDNPIARFFLPVARVEEVALEPGICPGGLVPGSPSFRTRVRFYWLFGVPGPTQLVTCDSVVWEGR